MISWNPVKDTVRSDDLMLMKGWFFPSLWLFYCWEDTMSSSFISFHLFHLLGKYVLCLFLHEISNFMTITVPDRQTELEGLKFRRCVWQTQRRPFCGLRFDLIRWEMKWHLTGCQIMPSVIFGCISWLHSPCLTWGNHPEVCQKLHWISRPQGNNMDISMEKAMSLNHIWLKRLNRGNLRVLSIASPLYLDCKMTAFCSIGLFSFSCCTMPTFFFILSLTNTEWMSAAKLAGWRVYRVSMY